jgi:hypothetical protein
MNENQFRVGSWIRASEGGLGHEKHEAFIRPCFRACLSCTDLGTKSSLERVMVWECRSFRGRAPERHRPDRRIARARVALLAPNSVCPAAECNSRCNLESRWHA